MRHEAACQPANSITKGRSKEGDILHASNLRRNQGLLFLTPLRNPHTDLKRGWPMDCLLVFKVNYCTKRMLVPKKASLLMTTLPLFGATPHSPIYEKDSNDNTDEEVVSRLWASFVLRTLHPSLHCSIAQWTEQKERVTPTHLTMDGTTRQIP